MRELKGSFIKVQVQGLGSYIEKGENLLMILQSMLLEGDYGDVLELSLVDITEDEYKKLPEFMGF